MFRLNLLNLNDPAIERAFSDRKFAKKALKKNVRRRNLHFPVKTKTILYQRMILKSQIAFLVE